MRFVNGWALATAVAMSSLSSCAEERDVVGFTGASSACATCHSAPDEGLPFRGAEPADPAAVGAHDAHLGATRAVPLDCGACHPIPSSVTDPGHLEDLGPGDVVFSPLAAARGASPTFDGATCAVYCHGQFPDGNAELPLDASDNAPAWTGGPAAAQCGTCHEAFPAGSRSGEHERHIRDVEIACDTCHGPILQTTHVNGIVNLDPAIGYDPAAQTCQACHGPSQGSWRGGD